MRDDDMDRKIRQQLLFAASLGLTPEQLIELDRVSSEIATRMGRGEITKEQAGAMAHELAMKHARENGKINQ